MERTTAGRSPTMYGTPGQMAQLYTSITRITEREPDSTFEDPEVQDEGLKLIDLLTDRLGLERCGQAAR